ncbi:ATP synthase protein I [Candidatus Magnetomoraceae bacterium gMMP-15]
MQLGLTMVGCILFCMFVGYYLDKWIGTKGVFISIFIILGIIGGGNTVYRQILELTESDKKNSDTNDTNESDNG